MKARRLSITLMATGALALGGALPAAAHGGHDSCEGFGEFFADYARGGYVDWGLDNPGLGDFATAGPGAISDAIAYEHALFCE